MRFAKIEDLPIDSPMWSDSKLFAELGFFQRRKEALLLWQLLKRTQRLLSVFYIMMFGPDLYPVRLSDDVRFYCRFRSDRVRFTSGVKMPVFYLTVVDDWKHKSVLSTLIKKPCNQIFSYPFVSTSRMVGIKNFSDIFFSNYMHYIFLIMNVLTKLWVIRY